MNRIQRITSFVGFCVVGLMLLVPPWKYIQTMRSGDRIPPLERNAGYALVFSPPSLKDHEAIREAFAIPKTREVVHTSHTNDLWSSIPDASPTPSPTPDIIPVEIYESYFEVRLDTTRLLAQCGAVALVTLGLVVFLQRATVPMEANASHIEETPKLVAWMPAIGQKRPVAQLVGAVRVPEGYEFPNVRAYMELLAERVQEMLEREDDPKQALRELVEEFASAEMLGGMPRTSNLKEAGEVLVLDNPMLSRKLRELDVPGELPKKMYGNNPKAAQLIEETNLWTWAAYVLNRPSDDLR